MTPETQARQQIDQRLDESTGQIIRFTDGRDPAPRSREIFHFFKPAQLAEWLGQPESLRRLAEQMPALPGLLFLIDTRTERAERDRQPKLRKPHTAKEIA